MRLFRRAERRRPAALRRRPRETRGGRPARLGAFPQLVGTSLPGRAGLSPGLASGSSFDLSATGIGLEVSESVPLGSLLQLELAGGLLLAVVVRVTEPPGQLVCNFIRELAEEELHALLSSASQT